MHEAITKERLLKYPFMKMEILNQYERLKDFEENMYSAGPSNTWDNDGSQRSVYVKNDKIPNAIIRYEQKKEKLVAKIKSYEIEMDYIEDSIDSMEDPMQREVLRLRYLDGEYCKPMPWQQVSEYIYGDSDEKDLRAVYRLHKRALQALEKQTTSEQVVL